MYKVLLFEDFTKLYLRWRGGIVRKEDKIDREAVRKFIYDYSMDKDKVTIHDACADFDENVAISDINDLTFKFGRVFGNFDSSSIGLDNLKFIPKYVEGDFDISDNNLKSFEGCPNEVGGDFTAVDCHNLESLKGLPKHIGGNLLITTPNEPGKFTEEDIPEGTVIDGIAKFSIRRKR